MPKMTDIANTAVRLLVPTPADRVAKARHALGEAEGRTDTVCRAYEDAEGKLRDAMVEAATGGPDRIVEARKARDTAKAALDDHASLVAGLRSRVQQTEAAEADAIAKDRAKQREQVVTLLLAAAEKLDAALTQAGADYRTFADLRQKLYELSDDPDKGIYGPIPKRGVADALASLLLWRGSSGAIGNRLMMRGQDESLAHPAFTGEAKSAAYQLAGINLTTPPQAA